MCSWPPADRMDIRGHNAGGHSIGSRHILAMDRNRQHCLRLGGVVGVDEGGSNTSEVVVCAGVCVGSVDHGRIGVFCWL